MNESVENNYNIFIILFSLISHTIIHQAYISFEKLVILKKIYGNCTEHA